MQQSPQTIDASNLNQNLLSVLQQEVDFGTKALKQGNADVAVTFFQSALQKMTADMPFYDHLVHNLVLGYKCLIEDLLARGDNDAAVRFSNAALAVDITGPMADDTVFRQRFAETFQNIGLAHFRYGRFDDSLLFCRKAVSIYRCPSFSVNLCNSLTASRKPGILSDFTSDLTPEQLGRHLFIACTPKSASTFLKNVLVNLTGYRDMFSVYAAGQSEHELYLPTLKEFAHFDTVTQQHCRAADATVQMMNGFGIKPVVLVRNIYDSVMSLFDFYTKQGAFYNTYFRADFQSLDDETKIDLIIDNVVPWYMQFVASWDLVERQERLEVKWLSYEELIADKPAAIKSVLNFYGLGAADKAIHEKVGETEREARKIRFNKGVAGRGSAGLSSQQKERICRLSRYYPSTDFGRIGL